MRIRTSACALLCSALTLPVLAAPHAASSRSLPFIEASDLARLTDIDGLSVSPDGRWIALQTRTPDPIGNSYELAWHVVPVSGGPPRRLADGGEPILPATLGRPGGAIRTSPAVWSPDGRSIAVLRKENGGTQIWRASVDGGFVEQLTGGEGDVRAMAYSLDGVRLLHEVEPSAAQIAAALTREGRDGFLFDRRFLPSHSPIPVQPVDVDFITAEGVRLTTASELSQRSIFVYDAKTRRTRAAGASERAEFLALTGGSAQMDRPNVRGAIALSTEGASAWTEARDPYRLGAMAPLTIMVQRSATDKPIVCAAAPCTGLSFSGLWWRSEQELLFARNEGSQLQDHALYSWQPGAAKPRVVLRTAALFASTHQWGCGVAGKELICFYEEPNRPRRLIAIDTGTGAIRTLFDPNPGFLFDLGSPPQRLTIRSASGVETYGYLVLPPLHRVGERLPLAIVTYRCSGFLRGGTGDEYPVFPLAAQGFAVLCFNVPDHDYERLQVVDWASYTNWSHGEGDPEKRRVQEGLEAAIGRLDEEGVIDPDRVAITGLSFGGETVMYALFHMPRLRAAIASGTEFGPSSNFLYGPGGREVLIPWGLGDPDSPRWDALSITRNAKKVRAPLLLNVSDHELTNALHPYTALRDAGKPVEMFVYPDEYHVKWQPAHRLAVYHRNIDWLNFWLRDVDDPDPKKTAQYERWRAMRARQ